MVITGCFGQLVRALIPKLDLKAMYHWHLLTDHIDHKTAPVFHQHFLNGVLNFGSLCYFSAIFDLPGYPTFINLWHLFLKTYYDLRTRVSRTGPRLRAPETGPPNFRGQGGVGSIFYALGVHRGRAPKPLEKAGQVGLGNEQTETELYLYKIHFHKNSTSTHELHMRWNPFWSSFHL